MELTTLGGAGLRVSRVALGCSCFGCGLGLAESVNVVSAALDAGITFFDTADVYTDGESERTLATAIVGKRDCCVLATKFRHSRDARGGSRKAIRLSLEASLGRLRTSYVDLYQMHSPDPATPIEETISTLQDLVREGKILYYGLCNVKAWQAVDAQRVAWALPGSALVSVQVKMNAIDLDSYVDLKPVARLFKLGLLAAAPLARGLLGGSYSRSSPPADGHPLRSGKGIGYWNETGLAMIERMRETAHELNQSVAQIALAVILSFPEVAAVLVGASSPKQVVESAKAAGCKLDGATLQYLLADTSDRKGE